MLEKAKTLEGFTVRCQDGSIGSVREFYFDDRHWKIRYLVPSTTQGFTGGQVLLSLHMLHAIDRKARSIAVALTRKQLMDSPRLTDDEPVSQQVEEPYSGYLTPQHGSAPRPEDSYSGMAREVDEWRDTAPEADAWRQHLHSTKDVSGDHVQATDGGLGHIEDFIIDDETWAIRYLVIASANWRSRQKLLVAPQWIDRVSWRDAEVYVKLSRGAFHASPRYDDGAELTRDYEADLHGHYRQPGYWLGDAGVAAHPANASRAWQRGAHESA